MRKFIITSANFTGSITLLYNEREQLVQLHIEADLSNEQHIYFMHNLPRVAAQLEHYRQRPSTRVIEIAHEVTFDDFYCEYGYKLGKLKAQNAWKRLSKDEQAKAYLYIRKYKQSLANGIAQLYPATYLNQKRWND
jgi:hypothetical protein